MKNKKIRVSDILDTTDLMGCCAVPVVDKADKFTIYMEISSVTRGATRWACYLSTFDAIYEFRDEYNIN
jgi:hypothetical protein